MKTSIKDLLSQYGLHPKKSLGQNFCVDDTLTREITDRLFSQPLKEVWEVGPGLGALTQALLEKAEALTLFEIDSRLKPFLEHLISEYKIPTTLHWGDFLSTVEGVSPRHSPYAVCGNLPYYCGTAIVRHMLSLSPLPVKGVFLLQDEVVKKMAAQAGDDDYGFLSVSMQLFSDIIIGKRFSPGSFFPNPQIHSTVMEVLPRALSSDERILRGKAEKAASVAFSQRRKMALSTISKGIPQFISPWAGHFETLGISPSIRPERLSPQQFIDLARNIP